MTKIKEFVACRNCRALVPAEYMEKKEPCPVCGQVNYTEEWEGMVIILDTGSYVAELMGVKKPWRYAIKVK